MSTSEPVETEAEATPIYQDVAAGVLGVFGYLKYRSTADELAALRCIDRRVNRAGAPFDKKRQQAARVVLEAEGFPIEDAAVGAFS